MKKCYSVYTDGACRKNPGPGGWAAVIVRNYEIVDTISGGNPSTTNNRMEMTALIEALKTFRNPTELDIYSDSKYLIDGLSKNWVKNWMKNNWLTSAGKPVLNQELWVELIELLKPHKVHYHWVKGHAGNKYNEMCDKKAVAESLKY